VGAPPAGRLSDDELLAIYDQGYVDQYDPHAVPRMRRLLPLVDLAPTDVVADFGCGNGVLLELIAGRIGRYVGVDFSEPFVREAMRRAAANGIANGAFERADLVEFCARHPRAFDAAFALDFSEHLYDDQFVRIFSAIRGALKPGGRLYIHTPNAEYFLERFHEWGVLRQVEGHVGVRAARQHVELLERCGFERIDVHYLAHYLTFASKFHVLGRLPIVGRFFRARLFIAARAKK
jgi:2-polyprenyl-6-hydroxyphenyl methylase / 3-demethylubiquinone-9 3-methyltransferase